MSDQQDCAEGQYILECVKTSQAKTRDKGMLIWRSTWKVLHAYAGAQPVNSEVTDAEFMNDDQQKQYAAAAMLEVTRVAFACPTVDQLKAALENHVAQNPQWAQYKAQNPNLSGWSEWADALQSDSVQMSPFWPANPLAGRRVLAIVTKTVGTKKDPKKVVTNFQYQPVPMSSGPL